jgi:hypothetical protein
MGEWAVKELRENGDDVEIHEFLRGGQRQGFLEILQAFRQIANQNFVSDVNPREIGFGEGNQKLCPVMLDLQKIVAGST